MIFQLPGSWGTPRQRSPIGPALVFERLWEEPAGGDRVTGGRAQANSMRHNPWYGVRVFAQSGLIR